MMRATRASKPDGYLISVETRQRTTAIITPAEFHNDLQFIARSIALRSIVRVVTSYRFLRLGWGPPSLLRSYGGQPSRGLPTVAHALLGKRERRMVAQIFPRWNRVADWLREAERFSTAA